MDASLTALAGILATFYVRLVTWAVYAWSFPMGDKEVRITVEILDKTPSIEYVTTEFETLLGVPV